MGRKSTNLMLIDLFHCRFSLELMKVNIIGKEGSDQNIPISFMLPIEASNRADENGLVVLKMYDSF